VFECLVHSPAQLLVQGKRSPQPEPAIEPVNEPDTQTLEFSDVQTSKKSDTQTSKSKNPDYQRTTVYLPKSIHKKLKVAALDDDREISDIVESLVADWLRSRDA